MDTDGAVGRAGEVTGCCCGAEAGSEHLQTGRVCCRVFVRVCAGWSPWMRMCVCVRASGAAHATMLASPLPCGGVKRLGCHAAAALDGSMAVGRGTRVWGLARDEGVQRFECERARVRARRRSSGVSQQHGGCEGSCCIAHYACTACMIWLLMYETQRPTATPGTAWPWELLQSRVWVCVREMVVGRMNEPQPNTATPRGTTQQIGGGVRSLPALF